MLQEKQQLKSGAPMHIRVLWDAFQLTISSATCWKTIHEKRQKKKRRREREERERERWSGREREPEMCHRCRMSWQILLQASASSPPGSQRHGNCTPIKQRQQDFPAGLCPPAYQHQAPTVNTRRTSLPLAATLLSQWTHRSRKGESNSGVKEE